MRSTTPRQFVVAVFAAPSGTAVLYPLLTAVHDSAPFLDALTTSLSLVAQWLLNGKWIESWFSGSLRTASTFPIYLSRHLTLTAVVYTLFLLLCIAGLRAWRNERATFPGLAVSR